jgi:hypothetical protein
VAPVTEMGIEPLEAESIARLFHETYERLAPQFSYETRKASAVPWEQVPENNRKLMIAVAATVLAALSTRTPEAAPDYAALAEKCAVACRSESFPSTATYETRIEKVLRENLSRTPEAAQVEILREALDAGAADALRYVLNWADSNTRVCTVMKTFTLPGRETTRESLERLYTALAQVRHPLEEEG